MGANAQTSVPTFTAGEILTAANMNISARTGIPVFADSTARDAAFGGTGEKTLAEGQFAYLESTNATQYYDGSTWQAVGTTPAMVLISSTTIGTAVSSVTVSNAFSATYDNYRIVLSGGVSSTAQGINFTLGATATGYYRFTVAGTFNAGTVSGFNEANTTAFNSAFLSTTNTLNGDLTIFDPFNAKNTQFYTLTQQASTTGNALLSWGYLANTTSYTAFTLTPVSSTLTGGTIRVYGYQNS